MIVKIINRILNNLNGHFRFYLFILIWITFFTNIIEILSIFLLYPYLDLLINQNISNNFIEQLVNNFFIDTNQFLYIFTIFYLFLIFFSFLSRMYFLYYSNKYIYSIGYFFLDKVLKNLLSISYSKFIKKHHSDLVSALTVKMELVVRGVIQPIITIFSTLIMIVLIVSGLLYINFYT